MILTDVRHESISSAKDWCLTKKYHFDDQGVAHSVNVLLEDEEVLVSKSVKDKINLKSFF